MDETTKASRLGIIITALVSVAIVAALVVVFQPGDNQPAPVPPSTEWTTAPEDGVQVELPGPAMQTIPVATPDGQTPPSEETPAATVTQKGQR